MYNITCKRCSCYEALKNGFRQKKQRYRCNHYSYNFTFTVPGGKHPELKALAILFYGFASVTMTKVVVYKWIQGEGQFVKQPMKKMLKLSGS